MPATKPALTLVPDLPGRSRANDERSDDELMLLTRAGKQPAFEALVRRHQARVLRTAARYLGNASLAPDVAQRAFVELFHARDRYKPCGKFWLYLSCIILNQCRMTVRSEKRHSGLDLASVEPTTNDEDSLLAREQMRELEASVQRLSHRIREVIVLRHVAGLTLEEIADVLQIPLGTVKSRLFTALEQLRGARGGES